MFNVLAPATVQHHISAGAQIKLTDKLDLEVAAMYVPREVDQRHGTAGRRQSRPHREDRYGAIPAIGTETGRDHIEMRDLLGGNESELAVLGEPDLRQAIDRLELVPAIRSDWVAFALSALSAS